MSSAGLTIAEAHETIFFGRTEDGLRQWIEVSIENSSDSPVPGKISTWPEKDDVWPGNPSKVSSFSCDIREP